ncbi:SIR2 family protein [Bordetella sp. 2513F-2]
MKQAPDNGLSPVLAELADQVARGQVMLFVGAGASMQLGLPSSRDALVEKFAADLGYEPDDLRQLGDFHALAEYYRIRKGGLDGLRDWMETHWHPGDVDIGRSRVHRLICELDFPLVYTTNYDRWIERAYEHHGRPYVRIGSVSDLPGVDAGLCQIVKFHGDLADAGSIILDESTYFERLEFETPLDIKFRADVLGRGVLFIGYALSDVNLRFLFHKLARIWRHSGHEARRPQSYIFSPWRNPVQEAILDQWGIRMITLERDDPADALGDFLEGLLQHRRGQG